MVVGGSVVVVGGSVVVVGGWVVGGGGVGVGVGAHLAVPLRAQNTTTQTPLKSEHTLLAEKAEVQTLGHSEADEELAWCSVVSTDVAATEVASNKMKAASMNFMMGFSVVEVGGRLDGLGLQCNAEEVARSF